LAPRLLTRNHAHHYRGFATTQRDLFGRTGELKPLLYTFRVLLTGIHLMRSGELRADLPELIAAEGAPGYLVELIAAKAAGEHRGLASVPGAPSGQRVAGDLDALLARLAEAEAATDLPEASDAADSLHDLLISARLP
jgi:predicted nucleotidyltransferase